MVRMARTRWPQVTPASQDWGEWRGLQFQRKPVGGARAPSSQTKSENIDDNNKDAQTLFN